MANANRGEAEITLNGEVWTMKGDIQFHDMLSKTTDEPFIDALLSKAQRLHIPTIVNVIYLGIQSGDNKNPPSREVVGEWVLRDVKAATEPAAQFMLVAFGLDTETIDDAEGAPEGGAGNGEEPPE